MKHAYLTLALAAVSLIHLSSPAAGQGILNPTKVTGGSQTTVRSHQEQDPNGDKPRIAVEKFTDKSAKGGGHLGTGMEDQLVTALEQTNAFIVIERAHLDAVIAEQDLANSDRFDKSTAPTIGKLEGLDFKVVGAVTEYEDSQSGGGVNIRSRKGHIGDVIAPALSAGLNQAHIAIDLRLIDVRTGRIVSATSVEGSPRDLGGGISGGFSNVLIGLSGSYKTPREKAVRACMIKAVNWIAANALRDGVVHSNGVDSRNRPQPAPAPKRDGAVEKLKAIGFAPVESTSAESGSDASSSSDEVEVQVSRSAKVRFKADTKSVPIGSVKSGETVTLMDEEGNFAKVRIGSGKTGWIEKSAIEGGE